MPKLTMHRLPVRRVLRRWFCTKCSQLLSEANSCEYKCEYDGMAPELRPANRVATATYKLESVEPGLGNLLKGR